MSESQVLNPGRKLVVVWTEYVLHTNAARFFLLFVWRISRNASLHWHEFIRFGFECTTVLAKEDCFFPTFYLAVVVLDECASQGRGGSRNLMALSGHLEPWALVWESPALLSGDERERADQGEDMWGNHLATTLGTNEQPECSRVHWSLKWYFVCKTINFLINDPAQLRIQDWVFMSWLSRCRYW